MLLPVGYDNFREVIEKGLDFIDKSLFIKELLDDIATKVAVITRPRRFGKTMNLSMLRHFLTSEIHGLSTAGLFDNLKIMHCDSKYLDQLGKSSVIFITLKEAKEATFSLAKKSMARLLRNVYFEHKSLLQSEMLDAYQKKMFTSILEERADEITIKNSLLDLTHYLYLHTQKKPWLLIDEYDTPIQTAYASGYYEEMIGFMRMLLGPVLKSNDFLEKAVITGILRVAKESLFSGVNNLEIYSVLRQEYSHHFGFTEPEIEKILSNANLKKNQVKLNLGTMVIK